MDDCLVNIRFGVYHLQMRGLKISIQRNRYWVEVRDNNLG